MSDSTTAGTFRFGKRIVYLANALTNHKIGMEETDDGRWSIYFHTVLLATFDERSLENFLAATPAQAISRSLC